MFLSGIYTLTLAILKHFNSSYIFNIAFKNDELFIMQNIETQNRPPLHNLFNITPGGPIHRGDQHIWS